MASPVLECEKRIHASHAMILLLSAAISCAEMLILIFQTGLPNENPVI